MLIGWYILIEYSTDIDIIDIMDSEVLRKHAAYIPHLI